METNKEATKPENRQDDVETLKAICAEIVEQYEQHREEEKQWFDESPAFIMERFGLPIRESMWAWVQACTMNHYNKTNSVEISTNSITEDEIKEALATSDTDGKQANIGRLISNLQLEVKKLDGDFMLVNNEADIWLPPKGYTPDGKLVASVQNALDELEKALHGQ